MARLIINPDSADAWAYDLAPGEYWVGRSPESGLVIDHPSISSTHCHLAVSDRQAVLRDAASSEGTFVNGRRVEEAVLRPGAIFRLGQVEVRFECELPEIEIELPPPPTAEKASPTRIPASTGTQFRPQVRPPQAIPNFYKLLPGTLLYPLKGSGIVLLIAGGVFFVLLGVLPLIGILLTGYLFNYAKRIVASSAAGEPEPPDWPDFTNWLEDMVLPYLHLAALMLLTYGPAQIALAIVPSTKGGYGFLIYSLYAIGGFIAPMAMLSLSMFDSFTALNPIGIVWSILRIPVPYLAAALAFGAVIGCYLNMEGFVSTVVPIRFLAYLVAGFVNLYLLAVAMRMLGLLYFCKKEELGWFER